VASALVKSAHLEPGAIMATVERLHRRVAERFPDRGLAEVALDLVRVASAHEARADAIHRPARGLQLASAALILATLGALVWLLAGVHAERLHWRADDGLQMVQVLEAGLGALVFLGAAVAFLASLELRVKRRRALEALNELRALAHVVDMHQLSKDPDRAAGHVPPTPSSPAADLSPAELARYLEYCSEMLALLGKIAAIYAQGFADPVAVDAVDDFTLLTTSLSTRIGQKILILDLAERA
jgi:hypothetical protein